MEARFSHFVAAQQPRILLGSASASRRKVMDELAASHGFTYSIRTADIDEKAIRLPVSMHHLDQGLASNVQAGRGSFSGRGHWWDTSQ